MPTIRPRVLRYFAYGSNMCFERLRERTPSAERIGVVELRWHRLAFHKLGADGSGKCDIHASNEPAHVVHGVLYHLHEHEKPALDRAEGLGRGYEIKQVEVATASGRARAFSYFATRTNSGLRPFHWYKQLVLAGARENGLPLAYIDAIASEASIDDSNRERVRAAERILSSLA